MARVAEIRVTLDGLDDVLGVLRMMPERVVEACQEEVGASLHRIYEHTELIVPVASGFMRGHISELPSEDGLSGEVGWRESVFADAGLPFYPPFVEYGTSRQAAQPSLRPAFEEERPKFVEALRQRLRDLAGTGRAG